MTIRIRDETASDAAAIATVTTAAFLDAGHSSHTEQFIVDALRKAGQLAVSLVADDEGEIIGHVAVSPVSISDHATGWYGLGPVSVLPERHRQGVGTQLVVHALGRLRILDAAGCVVLGDPGYYERFGFKVVPALALPGVPQEYFQAMAFGGLLPSGAVAYHQAFDAQD